MGFLDAWHGRRWDTDGNIGDVREFPLLPKEGYCSRADLSGRSYGLKNIRRAATRAEANDEIIAPDDRVHLATQGSGIAHVIADSREQGGILGQDECQ
jgi:hypothetical protein